jgi:hypothetical protein
LDFEANEIDKYLVFLVLSQVNTYPLRVSLAIETLKYVYLCVRVCIHNNNRKGEVAWFQQLLINHVATIMAHNCNHFYVDNNYQYLLLPFHHGIYYQNH